MESIVSVIIPVYNMEKYLDKCLESVVNQTYKNLEIILVNDGSTDISPGICDKWARKDNRIQVIHKQNGGLSEARNTGLDICTGDYVVFIDSDDYVELEYVEYLYNLIKEKQADISICEYRFITPHGKTINKIINDGTVIEMDQREALYELCNQQAYSNSAWAKMYKITLFQGIRFPVGQLYEDIATTYKLFMQSDRVVLGKRALYVYLRRGDSIMTSSFQMKKLDSIKYIEQMCHDIEKAWPEIIHVTQRRKLTEYFYCWREIVLSGNNEKGTDIIQDKIYQKVKNIRNSLNKEDIQAFPVKIQFYVLCSCFGKSAMRLGFLMEAGVVRKVKLS